MKYVIIITCLLVSSIAQAEYFKGSQLKIHCIKEGNYHEGMCQGYIMGIHDAIVLMEDTWQDGKHTVCLPAKTKATELKKIVMKRLNTNDIEYLQGSASDIVWEALLQHYPCN